MKIKETIVIIITVIFFSQCEQGFASIKQTWTTKHQKVYKKIVNEKSILKRADHYTRLHIVFKVLAKNINQREDVFQKYWQLIEIEMRYLNNLLNKNAVQYQQLVNKNKVKRYLNRLSIFWNVHMKIRFTDIPSLATILKAQKMSLFAQVIIFSFQNMQINRQILRYIPKMNLKHYRGMVAKALLAGQIERHFKPSSTTRLKRYYIETINFYLRDRIKSMEKIDKIYMLVNCIHGLGLIGDSTVIPLIKKLTNCPLYLKSRSEHPMGGKTLKTPIKHYYVKNEAKRILKYLRSGKKFKPNDVVPNLGL